MKTFFKIILISISGCLIGLCAAIIGVVFMDFPYLTSCCYLILLFIFSYCLLKFKFVTIKMLIVPFIVFFGILLCLWGSEYLLRPSWKPTHPFKMGRGFRLAKVIKSKHLIAYNERGTWITSLDGTYKKRLSSGSPSADHAITWSPDGKFLATRGFQGKDVFIIDINLDRSKKIMSCSGSPVILWMPDSKHVIFPAITDIYKAPRKIIKMVYDGSNPETLKEYGYDNDVKKITLSPDGNKMIFEYKTYKYGETIRDLYLLDMNHPSDMIQLTKSGGKMPCWSPDGKELAFIDGDSLKVMNLENQEVRAISNFGAQPVWSPDGEKIAFLKYDSELWVINVNGSRLQKIIVSKSREAPEDYYSYPIPSWSWDSRYLAVTLRYRYRDLMSSYKVLFGGGPYETSAHRFVIDLKGKHVMGLPEYEYGWNVIFAPKSFENEIINVSTKDH